MSKQTNSLAAVVADHYNKVEQKSHSERCKSLIIDIRRFNNAMKSLMHYFAFKFTVNVSTRESYRVLDLGCGKGGDLQKYQRNDKICLVVGVDLADVSIEQCKQRYATMKSKPGRNFRGEFFVADLTRVDLEKKIREHNIFKEYEKTEFQIATAQFSLHYSFETYEQAVRFISNAADNLMKHGIFIGTYPDGAKLLKLARESKTPGVYEVEDILRIEFSEEDMKNPQPFGTKYHFMLKEVVDCPEFLVHPEVLRRLMNQLGFYEVFDRSFEETLKESIMNTPADAEKVREIFDFHRALEFEPDQRRAHMDETMWKVASIYRCFCYKKQRDNAPLNY